MGKDRGGELVDVVIKLLPHMLHCKQNKRLHSQFIGNIVLLRCLVCGILLYHVTESLKEAVADPLLRGCS